MIYSRDKLSHDIQDVRAWESELLLRSKIITKKKESLLSVVLCLLQTYLYFLEFGTSVNNQKEVRNCKSVAHFSTSVKAVRTQRGFQCCKLMTQARCIAVCTFYSTKALQKIYMSNLY